jgi:hypothetical protein
MANDFDGDLYDHFSIVFGLELGGEMMSQLFHTCDPSQLPIEIQFKLAFGLSFLMFGLSALVRETTKHPGYRWLARAAGVAAFLMAAGYGYHSTSEIKKLTNELQARKTEHASPVVSAVASMVFEVATPNGTQISWGGAGPLSVTGGRSLGNYFGDRSGFENAAREIHAADDLQNGADDAAEVTQGSPRKF